MAKSAAFNILFGANTARLDKALTHSSKRIRAFSQRMSKIGGSLSKSVTLPLVGLGVAGVKSAMQIETMQTSFVSLAGGAKEAGDLVNKLNKFTASTPFQLEGVATAAKQLIASGTGVGEVSTQLQFLGDIAATTGKPIEQFGAIFAKVNAKQKVELENLNSLADAGVPIFEALAEATGLPASELGAGAVSVEQFNATLQNMAAEGGFAEGAMSRLSQTTGGKFSTAMDNFKFATAGLMKSFMPILNTAIDFATRMMKAFTALSPEVKRNVLIIAGLLAAAGPIASAVGALVPILAGISVPVVAAGAAVAALAHLIITNFDVVEPAIISVVNAVIQFQNKTKVLSVIFAALKGYLTGWFNFVKLGFRSLFNILGALGEAVQLVFSGEFSKAGDVIANAFSSIGDDLVQTGAEAGANLMAGINAAMNADDIDLLQPGAISNMVGGIVSNVQGMFGGGGGGASSDTGGGETIQPATVGGGLDFGLADIIIDESEANEIDSRLEQMATQAEAVAARTQQAFDQVGGAIKNSIGQAFDLVMEGGDNMKENLNKLGGDLLKQLMKIAIGNAIAAAFSPLSADNAATGGLAGIAKSSFLQALIPGMMPKLARGGLAFGPTMAVVGDQPNAGINPEVIAPLSKLRQMMQPQGGAMSATIAGRDLLLVGQRDRNRGRRTFGTMAIG
tara:strand:- start:10369 stop:12402 length:2034 start_codon:yes stop_codon:yes gene_type:complete